MAKKIHYIHSQMLRLAGEPLIIPNTAVAEIINYAEPSPVKDAPDWLLGTLDWRGYRIPLLSLEHAMGENTPKVTAESRIAIINCISGKNDFHFYGIITTGLPRLVNIEEKKISAISEGVKNSLVLSNVMVNQTQAVIPDLDAIESMVAETGVASA